MDGNSLIMASRTRPSKSLVMDRGKSPCRTVGEEYHTARSDKVAVKNLSTPESRFSFKLACPPMWDPYIVRL